MEFAKELGASFPEIEIQDASTALIAARSVKSDWELERMREVIDITTDAQVAIMKRAPSVSHEYQLQATLEFVFRDSGACCPSFPSIVAAGRNATILHYGDNNDPIDDDDLLTAIAETHRIKSHSAARRHRQYIGKLMRRIDPEPIRAALEQMHQQRRDAAAAFHELEALRDTLLRDGDRALGSVLERFPGADRQQLRQLLRQAQREADQDSAPSASRRLFKYLRELQAASAGAGGSGGD